MTYIVGNCSDEFVITNCAAPVFVDANTARANCVITMEKASSGTGGFSAGNFGVGDTIHFDFTSYGSGSADLTLRLASNYIVSGTGWDNIYRMGDMPLADLVSVRLNGAEVSLDGILLEGGTGEDIWHLWRDILFEDMPVKDGLNTLSVTFLRHDESYRDTVPSWITSSEPDWGLTFTANVDGLTVRPATSDIVRVKPCTIGIMEMDSVTAQTVPSESIKLVCEDGKLLLKFDVFAKFTRMTGGYPDDTDEALFAEYIGAALAEKGLYLDAEHYGDYTRTQFDVSVIRSHGYYFMVTADVSSLVAVGGYGLHFGSAQDTGEKNFTPDGNTFKYQPVEFEGRYYTLSYSDVFDEQHFWGCVAIQVADSAPSCTITEISACWVSVDEPETSDIIVWAIDNGTPRRLEYGEYTVEQNGDAYVVVCTADPSISQEVRHLVVRPIYTDMTDNFDISLTLSDGAPCLGFSFSYTLYMPDGGVPDELVQEMAKSFVIERFNLGSYTNFDIQRNPYAQGATADGDWSRPISGDVIWQLSQSGDEYTLSYSADLSGLATSTQTHYIVHFGAFTGEGAADYKPMVDISQSVTAGGITYSLVATGDTSQHGDASWFWGCCGIILSEEGVQ